MPRSDPVSRLLYRVKTHEANCGAMVKRMRDVQVTVGDANLKPNTAQKGIDWMYVGGKVQRAESKMINGTTYTDLREPSLPRRKIESNFFLTINTNMSFEGKEEEGIAALRKTIAALRDPSELCLALKFGPVDEHYAEDKYADVITKVDWKGEVEFGPTLRRLHAHVWVTIEHISQIQMNSNMLQHRARELFNKFITQLVPDGSMRIKKLPYVHVKLLPQSNWATIMRQYIHKAMTPASTL